jgi:hypothetical protein
MPTSTLLKEQIADWTDVDHAQYALAVALGLMTTDTAFATKAKHVFWSANPVGDTLFQMLRGLASVGVLQTRDEPDIQFRWNPDFRGSWE